MLPLYTRTLRPFSSSRPALLAGALKRASNKEEKTHPPERPHCQGQPHSQVQCYDQRRTVTAALPSSAGNPLRRFGLHHISSTLPDYRFPYNPYRGLYAQVQASFRDSFSVIQGREASLKVLIVFATVEVLIVALGMLRSFLLRGGTADEEVHVQAGCSSLLVALTTPRTHTGLSHVRWPSLPSG